MLTLAAVLALATAADDSANPFPNVGVYPVVPSEWILERGELDGVAFRSGSLTFEREGFGKLAFGDIFAFDFEYHFDPVTPQPTIDLRLRDITARRRLEPGFVVLGIYRIENDRLFLCFNYAGGTRPTRCATNSGDRAVLLVFKKQ